MSTKKQRKPRRKRLHIFLINDDELPFEYVTKVLMAVCGHNVYQAEQCAMITHNSGECHIWSGLGNDPYLVFEHLIKHGLDVKLKSKKA
jgi:ATP-dependent Clp protease adaptor protein ClpS|tara:strand:+ start:1527 stop:1793 length:267 start_codon:yes stop_codon:yes gene_type:complete